MPQKWEIQPICKTCHYRRLLFKGKLITYSTYWEHTACHYCYDTGRCRDGTPQGDYCPNYIPKGAIELELYGVSKSFKNDTRRETK